MTTKTKKATEIKVIIFQGEGKVYLRCRGIGIIRDLISVRDYKKTIDRILKKYRGHKELIDEKLKEFKDKVFQRDYVLEYSGEKILISKGMIRKFRRDWNIWLHLKPIYNVFKIKPLENNQ